MVTVYHVARSYPWFWERCENKAMGHAHEASNQKKADGRIRTDDLLFTRELSEFFLMQACFPSKRFRRAPGFCEKRGTVLQTV